MNDLEYRIAKLELKPGDVLIIKTDRALTAHVAEQIKRMAREAFAADWFKVIVLDRGFDIEKISPADIEARAS